MPRAVTPETVALVRRLYSEGATLPVLKAESGLTSLWTIYRCFDGHYDDGSGAPLPLAALPRRRNDARMTRAELVRRLWRSAERQVNQIETRIKQSGHAPDVSERDARALAVLVRTLRELSSFDEAKRGKAKQQPKNDEPVPRDLGELRRELTRKLRALAEEMP
jgi:hypothetical protein